MNDDRAGRIRANLYAILDNYDEALDPVRRQTGSMVRGSKEPPLPISAHILDVRAEAHKDLTFCALFILGHVKDVNGQLLQHGPTGDTIAALVPFIERWVDWMLTEAPEAADQLETRVKKHAGRLEAIANPKRRDWMPIGDCPVTVARDGVAVPCGGQVRAYNQLVEEDDVAWSSSDVPQPEKEPQRVQFIKCPDCGTEDTLGWWMSQIAPEGSDLAPAATVIACVTARTFRPLTHELVRKWASLGNIRRHGKDLKGRTLYSSAAVLAYATTQEKEEAEEGTA